MMRTPGVGTALVLLLLAVGQPYRAFAQASGDTGPRALRLGPISAIPSFKLSNLGVDTNVFNELSNPKRDTTFTFVPALDLRMRLGRGSLVATTQPSFGYFRQYVNQRSRNVSQTVAFELPFNRITVRTSYHLVNARDRPTLEIDTRVRRRLTTSTAGFDVRVSARTTLRMAMARSRTAFREGEVVDATDLAKALNRSADSAGLSFRYALTSLTTVVLLGEWQSDNFDGRTRNAVSYRIMPGVEFSKFALISGAASVGARRLLPSVSAVPEYRGVAARVALSSVIRGRTRLGVSIDRDVEYSYDVQRPYYVQTNGSISVTHRVGTRWDLMGGAGTQQLQYRASAGGAIAPAPAGAVPQSSVEKGATYGFSVGYYVAEGIRVGLDGRRVRRAAAGPRHYEGWQFGSSVSYAF